MQAYNRPINDWYNIIEGGQIKLPRFQRFEAWDTNKIMSLINTIVHNLPLGITLILEVGDEEKFVSRYLQTAPQTSNRVIEHLLDGQQRLTALWRVLHNNYDSHTYFVYIPELDQNNFIDSDEKQIYCRSRYKGKLNRRYPLWCDDPSETLRRGLIPTNLLRPVDMQNEIDEWTAAAVGEFNMDDNKQLREYFEKEKQVNNIIKQLRDTVKNYNLPFLKLLSSTEKDVALEVFINMNTNSKPLSTFDIIVAEVEAELGQSLHDKQTELLTQYPDIEKYDDVARLILNTSSLLQNKLPNQRGAWEMNKTTMVKNWDKMSNGLHQMTQLLHSEGIYDNQRLPTNAILWVLAALYNHLPTQVDQRGWAESILKQYIWRSFFTSRYENSAASNAYSDYMALQRIFTQQLDKEGEPYTLASVPIFNDSDYGIADADELVNAAWPKKSTIRGRAVLAITTKLGAIDFATGQPISSQNIDQRHYHHLFPDALLKEAGIENRFIAMNCALITDKTNLNIGRKDPLLYLKDRYEWASESTVSHRLDSHLIPINELANGGYENTDDERVNKIRRDYEAFIHSRAQLFEQAAYKLCNGEPLK